MSEETKAEEAAQDISEEELKESMEQIKEMLIRVERYGLDDQAASELSSLVGTWNTVQQLMVSSYIKNMRFKMRVMHRSLEMLASGMIDVADVPSFSQVTLEQVGLREWRNPDEENRETD